MSIFAELDKLCSIPDCTNFVYYRTKCWCAPHYQRFKRTGDPLGVSKKPLRKVATKALNGICSNKDCGRVATHTELQLCYRCYQTWRAHHKPDGRRCNIKDCGRPHNAKGFCRRHYNSFCKHGDPLKGVGVVGGFPGEIRKLTGEHINKGGYKKIRVREEGKKVRWILEHRYVMEKQLGRPLTSDESVHHKDGDRLNNVISNLELWVKPQPNGIRVEDAVRWAKEILDKYKSLIV